MSSAQNCLQGLRRCRRRNWHFSRTGSERSIILERQTPVDSLARTHFSHSCSLSLSVFIDLVTARLYEEITLWSLNALRVRRLHLAGRRQLVRALEQSSLVGIGLQLRFFLWGRFSFFGWVSFLLSIRNFPVTTKLVVIEKPQTV